MHTYRRDTPVTPDLRLPHRSLISLAIVMLVVLGSLRVLLFVAFPIFLTNDSPEYLVGSDGISRRLDFANAGLSTWRSPLYPVVLALSRPLTQMKSDRIIGLQIFLGLTAIVVAALLGYLINSPVVGIALVTFIGLNPVYLLYEHAVMTEVLFTLAVLCLTLLAVLCLRGRLTIINGAGLGIAAAACVLIRSNGLAYGAALILAVAAIKTFRLGLYPSISPTGLTRRAVRFLVAAFTFMGLIVGLWVFRNYTTFGIPSLSASTNQLLVFYWTEEGLLDLTLPSTHAFNRTYDPLNADSIWAFTWQMRQTAPSKMEPLANAMIREQLLHNPAGYASAVWNSALNFGGYPVPNVPGPATDLTWWFGHDVSMVADLDSRNQAIAKGLASMGFRYDGRAGNSALTSAWGQVGKAYLEVVRPSLMILFVAALILFVSFRRLRGPSLTSALVWVCLSGYFATLGLHALTLSAYDRYATPFDWIELLTVIVVASNLITWRFPRLFVAVPVENQSRLA